MTTAATDLSDPFVLQHAARPLAARPQALLGVRAVRRVRPLIDPSRRALAVELDRILYLTEDVVRGEPAPGLREARRRIHDLAAPRQNLTRPEWEVAWSVFLVGMAADSILEVEKLAAAGKVLNGPHVARTYAGPALVAVGNAFRAVHFRAAALGLAPDFWPQNEALAHDLEGLKAGADLGDLWPAGAPEWYNAHR